MDFSCVGNCYLHKGKKEECVSNLVSLIIAQPKILKSGPCSLEALYIFVDKKKLNHTLVIDLPFQTFAVGFLVKFIDWI